MTGGACAVRSCLTTFPANIGGGLLELFRPGAFGNVGALDLILNWQHQRERPLARTGGGGLTLTDSDVALEMAAVLPDTREANDAVEMVKAGIMRGLSVEFHATRAKPCKATCAWSKSARLVGVGLVDVPAFPGSYGRSTRNPGKTEHANPGQDSLQ